MVIVSNKSRTDQRLARQKGSRLIVVALIVLAVVVLAFAMGKTAPMMIPLVLAAFAVLVPLFRHKPYFECYVTDDQLVHFHFRVQKEQRRINDPDVATGPDGQKQIAVHLHTIWGYESHSFFTKEQQVIQLLLRTRQGIIRTTPILVEHLNEKEKSTLFSWLDRLVIHNKQAAIAEDRQGPPQLN